MNVLVIGGAGYIGSHCVARLVAAGHRPVVYDNLSTGHWQAVSGDAPIVVGDVRDGFRLGLALDEHRIEAVMHFAALSIVSDSVKHPSRYFSVNVGGTATVVEQMAARSLAPLVFSSTCAVYAEQEGAVNECSPIDPTSPYGLSKLMAEQVIERCPSIRAARLRYFNAAGAHESGLIGESHSPETHLIPLTMQSALGQRSPIEIYGTDYKTPDGTCVRDYVHVMDLADAHLAALERVTAGPGGVWNLGTGAGASVLQVIHAVEQASGCLIPFTSGNRRSGDLSAIWADPALACSDLGWAPSRGLAEIMDSAWAWANTPKF